MDTPASTALIARIEHAVRALAAYGKSLSPSDYGDWQQRFVDETSKIVRPDLSIDRQTLAEFRGRQIFVSDRPNAYLRGYYNPHPAYYAAKRVLNRIIGHARGGIRETMDSFQAIAQAGCLPLLGKYPTPLIGNPFTLTHKGYRFTNRYLRHIYLLSLVQRHLQPRLAKEPVFLDIGSSYGIFSSLLKQELPQSTHILVDMPGQLILAHYYLGMLFPQARIASFDTIPAGTIDRAFIRAHDFVLIPPDAYGRLDARTADVVTNFSSLSEMSREWFFTYLRSAPLASAPYLFTVNRYDAAPTFTNDLTVLDYGLHDYRTILMRTFPFMKHYYVSRWFFGYRRISYPSELFQFIGERRSLCRTINPEEAV